MFLPANLSTCRRKQLTSTGSRAARGLLRLQSGESLVASVGIAVAVLILFAVAGSAWWTLEASRQSQEQARAEHLATIGELVSRDARSALHERDPAEAAARLHKQLSKAARDYRLADCRVTLADGAVLFDSSTPGSAAAAIPERFPVGKIAGQAPRAGVLELPIDIPARGEGQALLTITAGSDAAPWEGWKFGIGVIGAAGFIGVLLVYRWMRARFRALGAIRDSLMAISTGESSRDVLAVSGELGPEAAAWNALLSDRDALKKRRVEEELDAATATRAGDDSSKDLSASCDALWNGLILIDPECKVRYANGAAAVYLSTRRESILGADLREFATDAELTQAIDAVTSGKVRNRLVVEVNRSGARRAPAPADSGEEERGQPKAFGGGVLRFTIRAVRRQDPGAAIVLIEDVTQQRAADEARQSFVAQAAHELRTPLTNIRLYLEQLLENETPDPQAQAKALNVINQESRRLERIIGDMLSVSEIEAGSMKLRKGDVRLAALLNDLHEEFKAQAFEKGIDLSFDLPPKMPVIEGDRDKVLLAVHNLLGNAVKYTPAGGRVVLRLDATPTHVKVDVTDTGIGIKEEEFESIFQRFYRAKDQRISGITGTGLGLALARDVARLHGGDITVRSEIDKGSTFTLTLPASAPRAIAA